MIQSLSYTEMNHAVPGSTTFSPRMEHYFECEVTSPSQWSNPSRSPPSLHSPNHLPECEVPSPSQWSDPCRSPPSLHSPVHYPADLEKLKEEPFSPPSGFHSLLQIHRPMSREGFENSISLAELLEENASLIKQHTSHSYHQNPHHQQQQLHQQHQDQQQLQQQIQQQQQQQQHRASGLKVDGDLKCDFLDTFTVKKEIVEPETSIYNVSSTSGVCVTTSYVPTPTVVQPQVQVSDSLRTVELMALDYYRQYVQRVSYKLGISKDPNAWSTANVRSWLEYEAEQQGLPPPSLMTWNWTGADLSSFSEGQFRELIPHGGELYYAKLEIWREALRTTIYQTDSTARNLPISSMSMPQNLQYLHPTVTQASSLPTQPLTVHVQPHGGPPYHHYVPQMYQSPTSSSSSFSPPGMMTSPIPPPRMMTSPIPPPLIQLPPSPSPSPRQSQPSQMPRSPLQVPTPVIQVEQQQKQQQKKQQLEQQKKEQRQEETVHESPQKQQRLSPSPSASCSRSDSPPQLFKNTFMEKCIDVTNLLKPPAETSDPQTSVEAPDEVLESDDEAEKEPSTGTGNRGGTHIHLWQFLKELLLHPQLYGSCIRWLDRSKGVFKIEDSVRVARLWGKRKNRPAMNYDKLSRSIRQYYKKNIMKKTERSQRLVYQFCHPYGL